ncbi:MAG: hypothetical protein IPM69_14755, partial [Ignavibacteria bacterium]|nr:hypothetical protein [Ignavibacteria bacterium]
MKRATTKRRRMIEIYFVLYIAALVMLLPSKKDDIHPQDNSELLAAIIRQSFTLLPDKTVLNCRLISDSTGNRILSIDSTNLIMCTGNVRDVQYECIVIDQSLRQSLTLVSSQPSPTQLFSLSNVEGKSAVEFKWMPPLNQHINRSFIVRVKANASPRTSQENDTLERMMNSAGVRLTAETQFSVNIIFADGGGDAGGTNTSNQFTQLNGFQPDTSRSQISMPLGNQPIVNLKQPLGEFYIQPQNSIVKSIAYQQWTNKIFLAGISRKELRNAPQIKIERSQNDAGGTATISEIRDNEIILGGVSPSSGTMRIQLNVNRAADSKEMSVNFIIQPQPVQPPQYDPKMYPGQTYTITPNLPMLTDGGEVKAVLKEGNKERVMSPQGAPFFFTPDIADTQKILTLERYIGGKLVGQSNSIRVESYPPPELFEPTFRNGLVYIQSRTYGVHNGKINEVRLEITEGNAGNPIDQRGDMQRDAKTGAVVQTFRIRPLDTGKPFVFKVRAIDS